MPEADEPQTTGQIHDRRPALPVSHGSQSETMDTRFPARACPSTVANTSRTASAPANTPASGLPDAPHARSSNAGSTPALQPSPAAHERIGAVAIPDRDDMRRAMRNARSERRAECGRRLS